MQTMRITMMMMRRRRSARRRDWNRKTNTNTCWPATTTTNTASSPIRSAIHCQFHLCRDGGPVQGETRRRVVKMARRRSLQRGHAIVIVVFAVVVVVVVVVTTGMGRMGMRLRRGRTSISGRPTQIGVDGVYIQCG